MSEHTTTQKSPIIKAALIELPLVKTLELIRDKSGYFYLSGETLDGEKFVTSGIYVFRLNHMTISEWVKDICDVVNKEMGCGI